MLRELLSPDGRAVLDAIMMHVPSGLTLASAPDCTILRVSEFGSNLLGRPRDRLEGISAELHTDAYQVFDPETGEPAPGDELPLTRATIYGETIVDKEMVVADEAGNRIPILCNAGPIRDGKGNVVGGVIAWTDLRTQKALQAAQAALVEQRDLLIREVHHRVKNHLQIVASIIEMEGHRRGPTFEEFARAIHRRVDVLSAAHESSLKSPDFHAVDAAEHLHRVCAPLSSPERPVVVMAEAGLRFTQDQATPIALIVNEAVCNAIRHGFPTNKAGRIAVVLKRHKNTRLLLTVTDNGIGPAPQKQGSTLGLFLAHGLARQLGGECSLRKAPCKGAVFTLRIPCEAEAALPTDQRAGGV